MKIKIMKIKIMLLLLCISILTIVVCSRIENQNVINSKLEEADSKYGIDNILNQQKIIFIISVNSFEERCSAGYFVDVKGKKHIYELNNIKPFYSEEETYDYLMEHYDEFPVEDFFNAEKIKKCTEALYCVNTKPKIIKKGKVIIDCPVKQLFGVKLIDNKEEFVFLKSYTGISKQLADPYAEIIYKEFGGDWSKYK